MVQPGRSHGKTLKIAPSVHGVRGEEENMRGSIGVQSFPVLAKIGLKNKNAAFSLNSIRKNSPASFQKLARSWKPTPSSSMFRLGLHVKKPEVAGCVSESVPSFSRLVRGSVQK
jgi:hypothetical protein